MFTHSDKENMREYNIFTVGNNGKIDFEKEKNCYIT